MWIGAKEGLPFCQCMSSSSNSIRQQYVKAPLLNLTKLYEINVSKLAGQCKMSINALEALIQHQARGADSLISLT